MFVEIFFYIVLHVYYFSDISFDMLKLKFKIFQTDCSDR